MPEPRRGSATLAAFLLVLSCAALTLSATTAAHQASMEHRARREVACARFGALGGIALGPTADGHPDLVGPEVGQLRVSVAPDPLGRCVVTATATCGAAVRTLRRARGNPAHCGP
jgi:hypothetical protein